MFPMFGDPNTPVNSKPPVVLSQQQERVLNLVKYGKSVFFTGPAGTGKSVLLREIINRLQYRESTVAITASTGLAALNIGGITLHSFAGIGLGKESAEVLVRNILKKSKINLQMRWRHKQTLIIDEISMIDATLFDKVEYVARKVRSNRRNEVEQIFGGLQLVVTGDFFQLPPVPDQSHNHGKKLPYFAFAAKSWSQCFPRPIFLTEVFRQTDDTFIRILTNLRLGSITSEDEAQLKGLSRPLQHADDIEPCQLFPLRKEVDNCNAEKLSALPGPQHVYYAMESAGYDIDGLPISKEDAVLLLDRVSAPSISLLKINAQVMLVQNISQTLVNGSMGKVVEFLSVGEAADKGLPIAEGPSKLKSLDISGVIYPNHKYRPLTGHVFSRRQLWPVVRFTNEETVLFTAVEFTIQGFNSNVEACRVQVPLILAWAFSVHKSQGQTLKKVKIDLDRTFEKGQAYVAISRATCMDGLEIQNFDVSKVMAHPDVIAWQKRCMEDSRGSQ